MGGLFLEGAFHSFGTPSISNVYYIKIVIFLTKKKCDDILHLATRIEFVAN